MVARIITNRVLITALLALASAGMLWSALSLRIDPGVESLLPAGGDDLRRLRRFNAEFGADEVVVVALRSEELFSDATLERLHTLTGKLAALPRVVAVLSPTNVRDIDGDEFGPFPVEPYQQVLDGEITATEMGERLAAHPLYGGLLVSTDLRSGAVVIEVESIEEEEDAWRGEFVEQIRTLAGDAGPGIDAHVAGMPVEKLEVASSIARDQRTVVPLIVLMMAIVLAFLYRHVIGVLIPMSVMGLSVLWTIGIYALAGRMLNPVTSLLTPVVLVVSLASAVHYLNHYLWARADGLPRDDALQRAFRRARVPCFNAALTTAIGFASLAMLPIPAIKDFGLFSAAGILMSYGLTMVALPVALVWLPGFFLHSGKPTRPGHLEAGLRRLEMVVGTHTRVVTLVIIAAVALAAAGLGRLRVETNVIDALGSDNQLNRACAFIDAHLCGVNAVEILIEGVADDDLEGLRRVERLARGVRTLPEVRHVSGLTDLYARVNQAFHEGDEAFATLPDGPEAADDLLDIQDLLAEEAPGEVARFMATESGLLRVSARVGALNTASSQALFAAIRRVAADAGLGPVALTGTFAVLSNMSTELVSHQLKGLVPACLLILIAMMMQLRSVRLGVLCAIPSLVPVVMVYGMMGWTGIALSVPTAMIAAVVVGMTVDSAIHLMARYRGAIQEEADEMKALGAMLQGCGRAVVFAAVTAALGFGTGIFGSFKPTVHFAFLTSLALLLGVVSVLVLLPLLLVVFKPLRNGARVSSAALSIGVILLVGLGSAGAGEAPVLRDQFDKEDGPALHAGKVVLLLHGKPGSLRRMKRWEQKVAVDETVVVRVLDVREVEGKKTDAEVRQRLLDRVPEDVSILVDWQGAVATHYGLSDAELIAAVLDGAGTVCARTEDVSTPEAVEQLTDTLRAAADGCPASD